ncbi:MAG: hypothetical protein IH873_09910 [Chloroflexi bacterium]|nr:hypothetical protein [Chloroflexota bacterium]
MPALVKRKSLPLAALLLSLVITACAGAFAPDELSLAPSPGETAYPFTLPSAPDGSVSLDSYLGERNVVLVFYRGFW